MPNLTDFANTSLPVKVSDGWMWLCIKCGYERGSEVKFCPMCVTSFDNINLNPKSVMLLPLAPTQGKPKPTTGVCTVCLCPRAWKCPCQESDFYPKRQTQFFDIPAPPQPNVWRVETQWRQPSARCTYTRRPEEWTLDPAINVWRPWLKYDLSDVRKARSTAARYRKIWRWQSFRIRVIGYTE
jgi:hypothetical protein